MGPASGVTPRGPTYLRIRGSDRRSLSASYWIQRCSLFPLASCVFPSQASGTRTVLEGPHGASSWTPAGAHGSTTGGFGKGGSRRPTTRGSGCLGGRSLRAPQRRDKKAMARLDHAFRGASQGNPFLSWRRSRAADAGVTWSAVGSQPAPAVAQGSSAAGSGEGCPACPRSADRRVPLPATREGRTGRDLHRTGSHRIRVQGRIWHGSNFESKSRSSNLPQFLAGSDIDVAHASTTT